MTPAGRPAGLSPDDRSRLARFATALFLRARQAVPEDPPDRLLGALPQFFATNELAFLSVPRSPETARLLERPELAEACRAESDRFARLRAEFEAVRAAWRDAGVEPVLVKAGGGAPSFPHLSGNLDLLVLPEAAETAVSVLCGLGFVELPLLREPHKALYKRFRRGDETCAIHLHMRVEWCVSFLFEDRLWSRRQPAPDDARLCVPATEDVLLVTLAHALYENKRVRLGDLLKVDRCVRRHETDWEYVWTVAESKGWGAGLAHSLFVYDRLARFLGHLTTLPHVQLERCRQRLNGPRRWWSDRRLHRPERIPWPVGFSFSKLLFFEKVFGDRNEPRRRRYRSAFYHLLAGFKLRLGISTQPRFLVAFSGIDGSGKSSVARAVQRALEQCGIRTRYVWSRGGTSFIAGALISAGKRLLRAEAAASSEVRQDGTTPTAEVLRAELLEHPAVRTLWPWVVVLELSWTYAWRVLPPLLRGKVVVCDRYLADAVAELRSRLGSEARSDTLAVCLLRLLSPKPDAAVYLAVPPEAARLRQAPETRQGTLDLARTQATLLDRMAEAGRLSRIEAQPPLDQVTDRVVLEVLRNYLARCRPPLRRLVDGGFRWPPHEAGSPVELTGPPTPMPFAPEDENPETGDRA